MISKESLKALLKQLGATDEQITQLVEGTEDQDYSLPEGTKVFTPEAYSQLETNLAAKNKNTNINVGKEIAIKELKEKAGLDFEGKDMDTFISNFKQQVLNDAKLPADQAKKQWETEKETLQKSLAEEKAKVLKLEGDKSELDLNTRILQNLPKNRNIDIPDSVHLQTIKNSLGIKKEEGKEYYEMGGKRLQDDTATDLTLDKAIAAVYQSQTWMAGKAEQTDDGSVNGFSDMGGGEGGFKSLDDVQKYMEKKGIDSGSAEGNKILQDAITKNPKLVEA